MVSRQQLIRLLALPDLWAAQSGLPAETILRRIAEWAMCDAFPAGSFRNRYDIKVEPFDIYMSFRALSAHRLSGGAVSLGPTTIFPSRSGLDGLQDVLISGADIEAFCERVQAEPPWKRYRRVWFFQLTAVARPHLPPPPCPEAEERAIRHDAERGARATLNSMRSLLETLQGKPGRNSYFSKQFDGGSIDFGFWGTSWFEYQALALGYIEASQNDTQRNELGALNEQWNELLARHRAAPEAPSEPPPPAVAMRLCKSRGIAVLHGEEFVISERLFQLLWLLAEKATKDENFVSVRQIEHHLWGREISKMKRQVADVVRDLREKLTEAWGDSGKDLVITGHKQGYRLALPSSEIVLDP
jgi:DNA-binding winged helix-turn-helix (wHTH) protein